jgi:arylsulfatase A-like enzyme/tetratricopeptide (TPR) repeat protein
MSRKRRDDPPRHDVPATMGAPGKGPLIVIGLVAVLGAVVSWWWLRGGALSLDAARDAHVLLVTIDTLRADAIGAYGGRAQTPNLDRLAGRGARFDFAHAHAVVTLPSHTSILTGLLPYQHGIRDNSGYRVAAGTPTLATRLKASEFTTGAFIGGFPLTKRFGLAPGFDVYDDRISELAGDAALAVPERPANDVVSRAVSWIDRVSSQGGRFFGWVHVFDPHSPYAPPEPFRTQSADRPYDGEVAWTDRALGPLFDRLETLTRPTLVIVTSDHGESLGEHGEDTHGMFAYEATLRVPLIVALVQPGTTPARGRGIDLPARHIDIAPTILDAVGVPGDPQWLGSSLRDLIETGSGPDRPVYFESMTYNLVRGWAPLRGVIVEHDKFIDQPIPELYDLRDDPNEQRNLGASETARRRTLEAVLRTFDVSPPGKPRRENAGVAESLRSLGYVSGAASDRTVYTEADDLKNLVGLNRDLHKADELFHHGQFREAIQLLDTVIARRFDTADAHVTIARAYWTSGDADAAIATLERALAGGVTAADVRMRLGLYLAESGKDPARAITLLSGLPEDDAEAMNSLGLAYGAAGRPAEAIAAFERVLAVDPSNGLALQNIAAIKLQQGDAAGAEDVARRAIAQDPILAKAHTTLGVALARQRRSSEAIDAWTRAIELDAAEFDALYNLVVLLMEARRVDEARAYARQFVATAPPAFYRAEIEKLRPLARE